MAATAVAGSNQLTCSQVIDYKNKRMFYLVGGSDLEKFRVLTEIFHRILTPLYGSQDKALEQIKEGKDRVCYLLYDEETPVGVLVFKTVLSNEFAEFGITDSIEIKSLFLDHSANNSGKGLGSSLVDKLKTEVANLKLGHKGIHVTVSETKEESLNFFKKKGFVISHAWKDRYIRGVTEYLLSCPAEDQDVAALTNKLRSSGIHQIVPAGKEDIPELVHIIHKAHFDDIHALKKLSDGTFISGSKDNCLYKWNDKEEMVSIVDEVEPEYQDERDWITAVEVINDEYWISGMRNGRAFLWKTNGEFIREIPLKLPKLGDFVSNVKNVRRINCFAPKKDPQKPGVLVGFPTLMDEYNFIEGRTASVTKVHDNDWVYSINPIDQSSILTVTGCIVDLWKKQEGAWNFHGTVLNEGKKIPNPSGSKPKFQRAFISGLAKIGGDLSPHYGVSLFTGIVGFFDLNQRKMVQEWKEHKGRVWNIEPIHSDLFATGGEDKTVKLWDPRRRESVKTIGGHPGMVTTLLHLKGNVLLAGSCSEVTQKLDKEAQIRFLDLRG